MHIMQIQTYTAITNFWLTGTTLDWMCCGGNRVESNQWCLRALSMGFQLVILFRDPLIYIVEGNIIL